MREQTLLHASNNDQWKYELLKVIFPKGLIITKDYQVRTQEINTFCLLMSSESTIFTDVIIKKGEYLSDIPLGGRKIGYVRTKEIVSNIIEKHKDLLLHFTRSQSVSF